MARNHPSPWEPFHLTLSAEKNLGYHHELWEGTSLKLLLLPSTELSVHLEPPKPRETGAKADVGWLRAPVLCLKSYTALPCSLNGIRLRHKVSNSRGFGTTVIDGFERCWENCPDNRIKTGQPSTRAGTQVTDCLEAASEVN